MPATTRSIRPRSTTALLLAPALAALGVALPLSSATAAPPRGGVFDVSDLDFASETNGWGPVSRDASNGEREPGGNPMRIAGQSFASGLGTHASGRVRVDLGGNCQRFVAFVGVDDETAGRGSVRFRVVLDGRTAALTPVKRGGEAASRLELVTAGAQTLELRTENAGDGNAYDHADWGGAQVICD